GRRRPEVALTFPVAARIGSGAREDLDGERGGRRAVQRPADAGRRHRADHREVLQPIRADVDVGAVVRGYAVRPDEIDAESAVRIDRVSLDGVPRTGSREPDPG